MAKRQRRPSTPKGQEKRKDFNVYARTIPFMVERHSFGETREASMATVEVKAKKELLALRKRLLDMPEIRDIRHCDRTFVGTLKALALPYRPSFWFVPVGAVGQVDAAARQWEVDRAALVAKAKAAYPAAVEAMREPLGAVYNAKDYPTPDEFAATYWVDWAFMDMGVPGALREVRADIFQRETDKLRQRAHEASALIEQHLYGTLAALLRRAVNLLQPDAAGRKKGIREDNAFDKLFAFIDHAQMRNVTDAAGLSRAVSALRKSVRGIAIDDLRTSDELRAAAEASMQQAITAIEPMIADAPRAIHLPDDDEADVA